MRYPSQLRRWPGQGKTLRIRRNPRMTMVSWRSRSWRKMRAILWTSSTSSLSQTILKLTKVLSNRVRRSRSSTTTNLGITLEKGTTPRHQISKICLPTFKLKRRNQSRQRSSKKCSWMTWKTKSTKRKKKMDRSWWTMKFISRSSNFPSRRWLKKRKYSINSVNRIFHQPRSQVFQNSNCLKMMPALLRSLSGENPNATRWPRWKI